MKHSSKYIMSRVITWISSLFLACAIAMCGFMTGTMVGAPRALAEDNPNAAVSDPSPAAYVYQLNANSVVGVITNVQSWNRSTGKVDEQTQAEGSGVVIAEDGYVLTNYHVIEDGNGYQILMPSGEKAQATVAGSDSSLDLAVLQVEEKYRDQLRPVTIGSSNDLLVGSTVIAIGNPGGEILANTVTQGIVSALERSEVSGSNTTRNVDYIQHDAAINNGNSGGGLFNYKGELIGINTLKYGGSVYSNVSTEGLGFAIPIDTAWPIAQQLIENGEVVRPQLGVTVTDQDGPDEPISSYPPKSVCIRSINAGSSAEKAGLQQYDFIYAINGERVTTTRELTTALDQYKVGDTIQVTVVRYDNVSVQMDNNAMLYGYYFGNFGSGNNQQTQSDSSTGTLVVGGNYHYVTVDLVLEVPEQSKNA